MNSAIDYVCKTRYVARSILKRVSALSLQNTTIESFANSSHPRWPGAFPPSPSQEQMKVGLKSNEAAENSLLGE